MFSQVEEKVTEIVLAEAPTKRTYSVPEGNLYALEMALTKLAKRAKKLGQVLGYTVTFERNKVHDDGSVTRYHAVEIIGDAPCYAGWRFIATLQMMDGGTIIRSVDGEDIPVEYRNSTNRCDHCKLDRKRIDTYLVKHVDGTVKQIGRNRHRDGAGHNHSQTSQDRSRQGFVFGGMDTGKATMADRLPGSRSKGATSQMYPVKKFFNGSQGMVIHWPIELWVRWFPEALWLSSQCYWVEPYSNGPRNTWRHGTAQIGRLRITW